jgi:histone chaperone ASF1
MQQQQQQQEMQPLVMVREVELVSPNPDYFSHKFTFRMKLDVLADLPAPVDIRFVWVGSARSSQFDQLLDEMEVGPLAVGLNEFTVDVEPPKKELIPADELVAVTVLQISFSFQGAEFISVSYYVNVEYFDGARKTATRDPNLLGRCVLITKPAVTTREVNWGALDEE